ncbi:hypothetical protein Godav_029487, partial [Gossypium davidsonii]|nr:hypothetical protein [Gossypium davidsonii]
DRSALIWSVQFADWGVVCYDLLCAIPDNIYEGRVEIGWLRDIFPEPRKDSTEVERIRYARAYILKMIGGYLMSDLSRNLAHLRWLLKLVNFRAVGEFSWGWNYSASYVGIPTVLEDIGLLLDQRPKAQVSIKYHI